MTELVRLIGLIVAVAGVVFVVRIKTLKKLIAFWEEDKRIYVLAGIRILVGIILLLSASQCRITWIVFVIGILAIVNGVAIPVIGLKKSKEVIKAWQEKPDKTLRSISLIVVAIGLVLLYSA
jgi:uncharacterized protein YjeT (DUF2065 family)